MCSIETHFLSYKPRKADFGPKDDSLGLRLWGGVCEMEAAWSCGIRSVPFFDVGADGARFSVESCSKRRSR